MKTTLTRGVLQELRFDALIDEHAVASLAEDCLRLLRTTAEDFPLARQETWYRRIWSRVGGPNLQSIGASCEQLAHAQGLVVELMRALARKHPRGQHLVEIVADDLERVASRQGPLAGRRAALVGAIGALRQQLRQRSSQTVDERSLPEETRVLMLRGMIAAAWADGAIQGAEVELITRKAAALDLSARARQLIETELSAPSPLDRDLGRVDSLPVKRLIYRNVAAVVMADGAIQTRETMFLARMARALGLPRAESEAIDEELYGVVSVLGLDVLVSAVVRRGAAEAPRERAAARAAEAPAATRDAGPAEQLTEPWLTLLATLAAAGCGAIQAPLRARLGAYLEETDPQRARALVDPTAIGTERREQAADFLDRLDRELDQPVAASVRELREPGPVLWSRTQGPLVRAAVDRELAAGLAALERVPELEPEGTPASAEPADGDAPGAPLFVVGLQAGLDELDASVRRVYDHVMAAAGAYLDDVLLPALAAHHADQASVDALATALREAQRAAAARGAAGRGAAR